MHKLLANLNDKQKEAVTTTQGPLLVLAGAGSGKTTVLVNRIAYILDEIGVTPYRILAITFTNKAANEMKQRISSLVGDTALDMWIGTFHSICVRILRRTINTIGYTSDFVIYDSADSQTVMKECLKELNIDDKKFPPRYVLSEISRAKDNLMDSTMYEAVYKTDFRLSTVADLYKLYQKKLHKNNALDFDDIIFNTVKVLSENADILENYQHRFEYILVDEYQDTNNSQYMLISMLAQGYRNLCVVGDDDQSIYKFRGANIRNILDFEKEFTDANVIKLEQNYRSTQNILNAANTVISNNKSRKGKSLWTDNNSGDRIKLYTAPNEHDEAFFVAKTINSQVDEGRMGFGDIAILYRTNAQSRVLEEMLMKNAVPYRVLAGLRFYDRKEIKDIIAYLRVIHNPNDDTSIKRIINEPKRSIGLTTVEKIQSIANEKDISVFAVISNVAQFPDLARPAAKLQTFADMINSFIKLSDTMQLTEFVERIMRESGYLAMLELENSVESQTRLENLREFMSVVQEHEKQTTDANLSTLLENVTLVSDIDSYDEDQEAVVMMTVHSAKGLEFPTVFLTGLEEGIFPGMRSMDSEEEIEEERRLCYVAITRAKQNLFITNTQTRTLYGRTNPSRPSRFLKEISEEYIEDIAPRRVEKRMDIVSGYGKMATPMDAFFHKKEEVAVAAPCKYLAGDVVMHKQFGKGMIVSIQQLGKDYKLEIAFETVGTKQLMALFAKLEKL